jgi:polyphosphate kinase 2 (PPK2 family)
MQQLKRTKTIKGNDALIPNKSEMEVRQTCNEIDEMEKQLVNFDTILIKFWLQIDQEE